MLSRRQALALLPLAALPLSSLGCPNDQSLVMLGGQAVSPGDIDGAPLNLLPSGALLLGTLDAAALFASPAGNDVQRIVQSLVPVGPESGFVARRDVQRVYGAIYAMQGADFAGVVQGQFNLQALEQAAQARVQTPSGAPLVQTRYGQFNIYTVANIGFVPLTNRTILSGNETGMRRALDRLRYGRLQSDLPSWMTELLNQAAGTLPMPAGQARPAFAVVGDVKGQGVVSAAGDRLPFLTGLGMVRILGNFQAPGMNVVGSLTYGSEEQATVGSERLSDVQKLAYLASLVSTWGFGGSMPDMEVERQGTNVAFATQIDTSLLGVLLRAVAGVLAPNQGQPTSFWGSG